MWLPWQTIARLQDGSALVVTVAEYRTPLNNNINKVSRSPHTPHFDQLFLKWSHACLPCITTLLMPWQTVQRTLLLC
jgi:hypothetical protein